MNGFMLLVLVVLAGQVGPAGPAMPPSLNPVQPASMVTTPPPQTDYGWQINPSTGLLEYIVQISPAKAEVMRNEGKEDESTIPAVVAARVSKIIVRFGTEPIQSADINEVMKIKPVDSSAFANNLPLGRVKTLENSTGYDLQNVAGGAQPPALTPNLGSALTDAATSLSDRMADAVRDPDSLLAQSRAGTGTAFLQETQGSRGAAAAATTPSFPSAGGTNYSMPSNTAGLPTSTAPPLTPNLNNTPSMNPGNVSANNLQPTTLPPTTLPPNGQPMSSLGTSGVPGMGTTGMGVGANSMSGNTAGGVSGGVYSQPHSTAPTGNYTSLPGQSRPGFASAPLGAPTLGGSPLSPSGLNPNSPSTSGLGYNNPAYATNPNYGNATGYNNQSYAGTPNYTGVPNYAGNGSYNPATGYQPGYANGQTGAGFRTDPPSVLLADQRSAVPSTANANAVAGGRSTWGTRSDGYTSDTINDLNNQSQQKNGMENLMPVMFVLSLVVNFYLGMLIRKLLGRYRTLLSSVRSQTI